jgi:hypothetical protein
VCTRGSNRALLGGPSTSPLERSMRHRSLIAVCIGIAVLWLTQWGGPKVFTLLASSSRTNFAFLPATALAVLLAVVSLLPGFCAGAIAGRRGIVLGALTGLIGGLTYCVLFSMFKPHFSHLSHFFSAIGLPEWFWSFVPGLIITCAAGGATGELLRSNNRWRRP